MLVGVVGKPNCGKSTFFKAATLAEIEIGNYPFVTIKPNHGIGHVKVDCADKDFGVQCNPREGYCINHKRFVPIEMMDVAGLVPGAHEGKGMGNQFLDDLRQADVLIHVIDASGSTNEKGESVDTGTYDPADDIRFLEHELDMWYYGLIQKVWNKFSRTVKQEHQQVHKAIAKQFSGLRATEDMVKGIIKELSLQDKDITAWSDDDLKGVTRELRRQTKPMIIAANKADVPGAKEKFEKIKKEFDDYTIIPCSAESELALKEAAKHGLIDYVPGEDDFEIKEPDKLNDKQKKALGFIKDNVLKTYGSTGVQDTLNTAVFDILKYIAIFPGGVNKLEDKDGNVLPDCYLMPPGSTALDFAFRLHTDFGKNFVKAINVRSKLPISKDHKLENRDIIEIMASK